MTSQQSNAKSPEIIQLFADAKSHREAEAAKLIRWVPALGEVPLADEDIQKSLQSRADAEHAKNQKQWKEDTMRKSSVKEVAPVAVPAAQHPAVNPSVIPPTLRFVPTPAEKLYSRKRLNEIFATVCHVEMLRNRVKERVSKLLQPTLTARTLAAAKPITRLNCLSIPNVVTSDSAGGEGGGSGGAGGGTTGGQAAGTAVGGGSIITALREQSSKSVFYDPMDLRVPFEFKLNDYPTVGFQEHPYLGSDPPEKLPILPCGDDRCIPHGTASTSPYSLPEFKQPTIAEHGKYPTDDFISLPAVPLPFVPAGYVHCTDPPAGVLPPFWVYNFNHNLGPATLPGTQSYTQLQQAPPAAFIVAPAEEDQMSDDDDDGTAASLDSAHPTHIQREPGDVTDHTTLVRDSYDSLTENTFVVERLDAFAGIMNKIHSAVQGFTLKQL